MTSRKGEKKRPRPLSSGSQITVDISESDDATSEDQDEKRKLPRDLRKAAEGRERYDDFGRANFDQSDIFPRSGYYRIETIKRIQECPRTFAIANLRKKYCGANMVKCARLVLDLLETFQTKMENAKDPKIEEVQIPRAMTKWPPSLASLSGILVPGQDMVNFFTIELTRGQQETPTYIPFVTGDLLSGPWMPFGHPFPGRANNGGNFNWLQETNRPDHVVSVVRANLHSIYPRW